MTILFTQQVDHSGQRVLGVASPSNPTDAANKMYVDAVAAGMSYKDAVAAAPTGDVNISSPGSQFDGYSPAVGERLLLRNQADASKNGFYTYNGASTALTRTTDFDTSDEAKPGSTVSVLNGTTNAGKMFILTTPGPINLGTTPLTFSAINISGTQYTAGGGLTLTGTTLDVGTGPGIIVNADTIAIDPAYVPRKYATNVGDGTSSTVTITHNLATFDVQVEVYANSGQRTTVFAEVQRPSANTVALVFATAPASGAYRAVIMG